MVEALVILAAAYAVLAALATLALWIIYRA
jgi:hypothetical protein